VGVPHRLLFEDRFVCAVDADNHEIGDSVSLEEFSSLPHLATLCGHEISLAEAQLDLLGVARNTEVTTAYGLAPPLLRGTRRIALIHERLACAIGDQLGRCRGRPPRRSR